MANQPIIRFKRGLTSGTIPTGLREGEIAINLADALLYVGTTSGQPIVISGGGNAQVERNITSINNVNGDIEIAEGSDISIVRVGNVFTINSLVTGIGNTLDFGYF